MATTWDYIIEFVGQFLLEVNFLAWVDTTTCGHHLKLYQWLNDLEWKLCRIATSGNHNLWLPLEAKNICWKTQNYLNDKKKVKIYKEKLNIQPYFFFILNQFVQTIFVTMQVKVYKYDEYVEVEYSLEHRLLVYKL